MNTIKSSCTST